MNDMSKLLELRYFASVVCGTVAERGRKLGNSYTEIVCLYYCRKGFIETVFGYFSSSPHTKRVPRSPPRMAPSKTCWARCPA